MKKYFVCSDIHSFYTPLKEALDRHGFDINNQDHVLVVLGDIFDRGDETLEVYNFLMSIPKERRVLVRGNHELLYVGLLIKDFPDSWDFSNKTVNTFCSIAGFEPMFLDKRYWRLEASFQDKNIFAYDHIPQEYWNQIQDTVLMSDITKFILSNEWVNYFELKDYIFVHSFIPLISESSEKYIPCKYREDWRNATDYEWQDATWDCPWKLAKAGYNQTGKTIVCGHWHTSDFFIHLSRRRKDIQQCPIFKSEKYKLIGIDACTVITDRVNVLVIEE